MVNRESVSAIGVKNKSAFRGTWCSWLAGIKIHIATLVAEGRKSITTGQKDWPISATARTHTAHKEPKAGIDWARGPGANINQVIGSRSPLVKEHPTVG